MAGAREHCAVETTDGSGADYGDRVEALWHKSSRRLSRYPNLVQRMTACFDAGPRGSYTTRLAGTLARDIIVVVDRLFPEECRS
jgi:hypothetical protein